MTSPPLLDVENISVRFGGLSAVSDVSFTVRRGELLALIGPNGAGKTTLLNAIAGALRPTAGLVHFNGRPIGDLPPHRVNALGVGRTFQAADPFAHMTVRENVMAGGVARARLGLLPCLIGLGRARRVSHDLGRTADELLEEVGLLAQANRPASVLTAGQRRLLAIARALATGAELLLLDEPGAGLNEDEKRALIAIISSLAKAGKTVLFVEHDMPFVAQLSQRIIVLDHGCLIADGAPHVVRNDPKVLEAYLGRRRATALVAAPARSEPRKPLLVVRGMTVDYGGLRALDQVSLEVAEGEIVAVLGANGAGKSTLLKAIARLENVRSAGVSFAGDDIAALSSDQIVARGISLVPEGGALFDSLSVADNLAAGRYARRRAAGFLNLVRSPRREAEAVEQRGQEVGELFPILRERRHQLAGTLSGGQRQMLAIGRALMAAPNLLMLDEPSLGLAPQIIEEIIACLERLRSQGLTILLVEQNAAAALAIADRGYVLANGRVVKSGPARELRSDPAITGAYLGAANDVGSRAADASVAPGMMRSTAAGLTAL